MAVVYMAFDRAEYEIFRIKQWQEHPQWDGNTFSLAGNGNLFVTVRVGGRMIPDYPVSPQDIFRDLERVRRIYQRKRPEGGRFKIDEGGARQVNSGRDLQYFIEFVS